MLEKVMTTTKIVQMDSLSARELERLIFYCGGSGAKVAVIEDNRAFELRDRMLDELNSIKEIIRLNKVFPDPKVADIMEMADSIAGKGINIIIGIGGGSTMDSAKGVAAVLSNGGDLEDYLGNTPLRKIEKKSIKLILIPTTAGTGAEVTKFGVYTARTGRKYTLNNTLLQADIALLVSEYTYNLPPPLTAATTFDALSHALETLWNRNATEVSDRLAIEAAIYILRWMEVAYDNPVEGRREMLQGACTAGIAFNMTGTAAVHALSFILSEEWHIPHGVACAFTLEDVMRLNMQDENTRRKLLAVAHGVFGEGAEEPLLEGLFHRIVELKRKFRLPFTFADINVGLNAAELSPLFEKSLDDPKMSNNIVPVDMKIVKEIIAAKSL
jgi:alcohol dehydrogenase class IV